ncbi:efflux RND transporter periplasmic adaptor subunit [Dyella sp.]|uniref:efflux RND transporter periplasmic adaptor subunit n=1 Tax=Dyella sp. TaxID=1869338 RepID=UPI002C4B23A6|nr:efflux RND transporter periplasmic adaptor subunit [Rhodanobacteraceae bacterium]
MRRILFFVGAAVALVVAGIIGYFIARQSMPAASGSATASSQSSGKKILYWYDPMVPEQHFNHPGTSPMGMQMVPKYVEQNGSAGRNVVRIDPAVEQNLGVRSEVVKTGTLPDTLHVPGTIAWDQRLAVTVSARTDVTIEKLYVRAPYATVKEGQPLAEILAPQWSAAAAEYFALGNAKSADARALRGAARARLHALGMDDATIRGPRAGSGTITLRAPMDGVVSALDATEGQQISAGAPIMQLNGLDTVWVDAAIPQAMSGGVRAGTPIMATVSALPGETFQGQVEELLPEVDPSTRTQRARIVLQNPKRDLAPGMFANLRIKGTAHAAHPLVPDEAIIADGTATRVIERLPDGSFKPVRVKTGRSSDGLTEILAGLRGGERIVTSGQFLIDSEASLSGALERLNTGPKPTPAASNGGMSGMNMPAAPPSSNSKMNAMPGMPMPASSASSGHGAHP